MSHYDVAIIGGGAAGLSAALVLSRARRKVLVIDAGAPRNAPATHMHGYLSRDGMPPAELLVVGREEVTSYGGDVLDSTVTDLVADGHGFVALLAGGQRISARRLLVTTGLRDELPDIPGLRARWARDVLHCPYCHGHEVSNRRLGVLGEGTIEQLAIDDADHLSGVQMRDGCVIPAEALFVPPRFIPNSALLVRLGCDVDVDGWVTVDNTGHTSVPGVWAAGNIVDPRAQVITAAGAGSAAAIALNADLVEEDVRNETHGDHQEHRHRIAEGPPKFGHVLEVHSINGADQGGREQDGRPRGYLLDLLVLRQARLGHGPYFLVLLLPDQGGVHCERVLQQFPECVAAFNQSFGVVGDIPQAAAQLQVDVVLVEPAFQVMQDVMQRVGWPAGTR